MPRRSHHSLRRSEAAGQRAAPRKAGRRADGPAAPLGGRETHSTAEGDYLVRVIPGEAARKAYRCPGCQQLIPAGMPHLVVWPADDPSWSESAVDSRRHWHQSCWHRRSTRGGPGTLHDPTVR